MKKIKVAITGGIGTGKSTFTSYLESKGFPVINADNISNQLLSTDKNIKQQIIKEFGNRSYSGKDVNRQFLAEQVFSDPIKLIKLNDVLHPIVLQEIDSLLETNYKNEKIVFIEAALIYESGIEKKFDYVVLVTADYDIRLNRSVASKNFTAEDFKRRDSNQIQDKEKEKRADFVFLNNDSREDLFKKADLLLLTLTSL